MELIFNITNPQHKERLTGKVHNAKEYINLKLSLMEILMTFWNGNPVNPRVPYVKVVDDGNIQRAFIVCQDKISSFGFEYHIRANNRNLSIQPNNIVEYNYGTSVIGARAISEAKTIYKALTAREENTYCYTVLDIDETTCDEAFILFESLFMLEPGYIRFDHDINNADEVLHPLDHFDVNYSKFVHYKLGLPNRATLEEFLDIINKNTRCRILS